MADLLHQVPRPLLQASQFACQVGSPNGWAPPQPAQGDRERAELLVDAVVKIAGDAAALVVPRGVEPAGQPPDLRRALVGRALGVLEREGTGEEVGQDADL